MQLNTVIAVTAKLKLKIKTKIQLEAFKFLPGDSFIVFSIVYANILIVIFAVSFILEKTSVQMEKTKFSKKNMIYGEVLVKLLDNLVPLRSPVRDRLILLLITHCFLEKERKTSLVIYVAFALISLKYHLVQNK